MASRRRSMRGARDPSTRDLCRERCRRTAEAEWKSHAGQHAQTGRDFQNADLFVHGVARLALIEVVGERYTLVRLLRRMVVSSADDMQARGDAPCSSRGRSRLWICRGRFLRTEPWRIAERMQWLTGARRAATSRTRTHQRAEQPYARLCAISTHCCGDGGVSSSVSRLRDCAGSPRAPG